MIKHLHITFLYRLIVYILGIIIITLGVALTINANLGISPVSLFSYALSRTTGIDISITSIFVFAMYLIFQVFIYGRAFKLIQLFQVPFAILFGYFLGFFNQMIHITTDSLVIRILFVFLGLTCLATGIFLTVTARLIPMSPEGFLQALVYRTNIDFGKAKNLQDITSVTVSAILLFTTGNGFSGIGIGTILSTILVGRILYVWNRLFKQKLESFFQLQVASESTGKSESIVRRSQASTPKEVYLE